jgi:uncharacterized damage-inducible protein DinB
MNPTPAFLRGNVDGCGAVVSAWIRGLESAEEQALKWTEDLEPDGFGWSPAAGTNSIGGLLNHVATAMLRLGHAARGEEIPAELQKTTAEQLAPEVGDPGAVLTRYREAISRAKDWMKGLSAPDLETVRDLKGRGRVPAGHLWHKLVEHAHEHGGQIITLRKLWNARTK